MTDTHAQHSAIPHIAALAGVLGQFQPGADPAALASIAAMLYGNLPAACARPTSATEPRDRLAAGRSVAQAMEESHFESRVAATFLARSERARKKMILVVDDAADVLVTLGAFLEGAGFDVLKASGADAALKMVMSTPGIDALVTDVAMPGMSGVDLVLQVQEHRPDLPSVIVTAFADPAVLAALPATTRILRKPFRRADLVRTVKELVSPQQMVVAKSH